MLGKSGLLGSYFSSPYSPSHEELDICSYEAVEKYISELKPDFVINCTGYTAVDDAEISGTGAFKLNAEAVGKLALFCEKAGSILIHFSTDYVFDGSDENGYTEDSIPSPVNIYGESKLKGEALVRENAPRHYIIRTSWLFGNPERDFVGTVLKLAKTRDELSIVADQIGSPTFAKDLAAAVKKNFIKKSDLPPFGIYHITNSGACSWYDFASEIFKQSNLEIKLHKVTSDAISRPAIRPHYSILRNTKLKKDLRPWDEALADYLSLAKTSISLFTEDV